MRNKEFFQCDTMVLGEAPSLAVNTVGKIIQRQHGNQCYNAVRKPSTEPCPQAESHGEENARWRRAVRGFVKINCTESQNELEDIF